MRRRNFTESCFTFFLAFTGGWLTFIVFIAPFAAVASPAGICEQLFLPQTVRQFKIECLDDLALAMTQGMLLGPG